MAVTDEPRARRVLDVGCGSAPPLVLRREGCDVAAVYPATAPLVVAQAEPDVHLMHKSFKRPFWVYGRD